MITLTNIKNTLVIFISFIIVLTSFLKPLNSYSQIVVMLEADTNVYKQGEKIKLAYTIKNIGDSSIFYFDRNFVNARDKSGNTVFISPSEMLVRADWRESKSEYILLAPGDKISHTYSYDMISIIDPETNEVFLPVLGTIYFQYKVTRLEEDNFYYDFKNEHIEATTKIPIDAWTGTLESNEVIIELIE